MIKVAVFHWGEPSIHKFYLIEQLLAHNIAVDVFQYLPRSANKTEYRKETLEKIKDVTPTIVYKCHLIDSCLIKLGSILGKFNLNIPAILTNYFLPYHTRRDFRSEHYDYIITIEQTALFWLYRTDRSALSKTLHYSLEIQKESDPYFISPFLYVVLEWEQKLLRQIRGLIIQDTFRAKALLNAEPANSPLHIFYLPVSVPGNSFRFHPKDYLYRKFGIEKKKNLLLYFGAYYTERLIPELADRFTKADLEEWVLVLHGPDDFNLSSQDLSNIKISNELLSYDDLNRIIASATIGLALYDNAWPNTRYTAFSSEKIARYLQVGVPFIAFKNESYLTLKEKFNCCELIETIEELPKAIHIIENNYQFYSNNAYLAFEKLYCFKQTILPLADYIKNLQDKTNDGLVNVPYRIAN